jgi:hypothetical protein
MLARAQLRQAALTALQALQVANVAKVYSPGDWSTAQENLPAILLRATGDRKESNSRTVPNFTTTVTLEIEARLSAETDVDAQTAIEALQDQIEQTLFTNVALIKLIQQVASVTTQVDIRADAKTHLAGCRMTVDLECFEEFEPGAVLQLPALQNVQLHVDLTNRFDPTGTYQNPPFPAAVEPAPRDSGPDGRDEGALDINLPI